MSYNAGKDKIVKKCYKVYVRSHTYAAAEAWTSALQNISASNLNENVSGDLADWSTNAGSLTTANITEWGRIGETEEKPSAKLSEGEEINLGTCVSITISEMIEVLFNDLQVNKANYDNLRELFALGNVDVLYYDPNYATESIAIANINLRAYLEAEGNALNKVAVKGKKEVSDADSYFGIVSVTL